MKKLKPLCLVVLLATLVYGLVLPFCWGTTRPIRTAR